MAEARGADASDKAYELYALTLAEFDEVDVLEVVTGIAKRKRAEGEKAWPELGELIEPLEKKRAKRLEIKQAADRRHEEIQDFWQWARGWMELTGNSEDELLKRFPSFRGTKG